MQHILVFGIKVRMELKENKLVRKIIKLNWILILCVFLFVAMKGYLMMSRAENLRDLITMNNQNYKIEYKGVEKDVREGNVKFTDLQIKGVNKNSDVTVEIEEIQLMNSTFKSGGVFSSLSISMKGIKFNSADVLNIYPDLKKYEYPENVNLNIDLMYKFDKKKKELLVEKMVVEINNKSMFVFNARFGNVESFNGLKSIGKWKCIEGDISYFDSASKHKVLLTAARDFGGDVSSSESLIKEFKDTLWNKEKNELLRKEFIKKFSMPNSFSIRFYEDPDIDLKTKNNKRCPEKSGLHYESLGDAINLKMAFENKWLNLFVTITEPVEKIKSITIQKGVL